MQHWNLEYDADNIAWAILDYTGSSVNLLAPEVLEELDNIVELMHNKAPKGLVIQSGKASGFIAGADINAFDATNSEIYIKQGQDIFNKLAALPIPTVALIEGFCIGGGMELALACNYRVAIDSPSTKLGLPEIKLGIHPGWGGSVRLPSLVGSMHAMRLMLTGRVVNVRFAKKIGLVQEIAPKYCSSNAAIYYINNQPVTSKFKQYVNKLSNATLVRGQIAKLCYKSLAKKSVLQHQYPAPFALLDNWVQFGVDKEQAFTVEAQSVVELMVTSTAQNLLRVFKLQEKLKSLANQNKHDVKISHVHVVGAGVMGADIAAVCALKGITVTLQDSNEVALAKAFARINKFLVKKLGNKYLATEAKDRVVADKYGYGISKADLVIEAIVEKLEAKQQLFTAIEPLLKPGAYLASNTSTIMLDKMRSVLQHPENFIGIHFFNPVAKMQLVEVISDNITSEDTKSMALGFVKQLGKLPVPVANSPGFLVNRILIPYILEAMLLLEEGASAEVIDKNAIDFGMPMGPIELADAVGLDVCVYAATSIATALNWESFQVPIVVSSLIEQGKLGKKTAAGFYKYNKKGIIKNKINHNYSGPDDVIDRLIMRIYNESVACISEGVVDNADLLDAAMIFGTGFAPFTGGPMQLIKSEGKQKIVERLQQLADSYGARFTPVAGWEQ